MTRPIDLLAPLLSYRDWRDGAAVWLVFLVFILLPVGRMSELPVLILAIAGGVLLYRARGDLFEDPGQRLFARLFLLIWLPMLLALPTAVQLAHSAKDVLLFPRFYLAGVFVVHALRPPHRCRLLLRLAGLMLAFWLVDAIIQAIVGVDLFGHAYVPQRLNAVYGERHLDFGVALPTLAPLLLYPLRRRPVWFLLAAVITGVIVLLAGSRGGWVSYAVVLGVLGLAWLRRHRPGIQAIAMAMTVAIAGVVAVVALSPDLQQRMKTTAKLFSGDWQQMDEATAYRLTIWQVAGRMIADQPITGVGVAGFRYGYPHYAGEGDPFIVAGSEVGAFYAHQIVIQVLSETGLVGLAGLIAFYVLWGRSWQQATPTSRLRMAPFGLAALAWLFPFNSHASFYGSQWALLLWLLLALYCSGWRTAQPRPA